MCGIAGVWSAERPIAEAEPRVRAMLNAMSHRGPDGSGTMSWPGGAAGMVRLALVDLSARGQQPLWSPDGKVAIVFNGEMYNHVEHRARLKANGYPFKSESDTEVVLALYLERGLQFVDNIRGMFALAIFDFRERGLNQPPTLVLGRDPFGIKPLYVARQGQSILFASELRGLLQAGLLETRINREAVADFLAFGFVVQPRTMLDGVMMLERGTLIVSEPGRSQEHRFWLMPPASDSGDDFATAAQKVRAAIEESVRLHSMADTPVGAFLSGGVDSSAIVSLMARHNSKLRTYTVRLKDPACDESSYAREFAAELGCIHTEVEVGDDDVRDLFPLFAAALDQPSTDGFNTWLVSRAAARDVKGVVSGLGGDEWFAGYPVVQRMNALQGAKGLKRLGRVAGSLTPMLPISMVRHSARLAARSSAKAMWVAAHRVFLPHDVQSLSGVSAGEGVARLEHSLADRLTDRDAVDLGCQLDIWAYMGCQLLRDSDVTSMAHSLELRVPLVDKEVAACARSIASIHKTNPGAVPSSKRVLVEAMRDVLPKYIHSRPKRGFALPQTEWLAGPLKPIATEALAALRDRRLLCADPTGLSTTQQWSLVILELWCQNVVDRMPSTTFRASRPIRFEGGA